ncbi:hypothetical protein NC652_007527 [Populus alba x Populus x berolinensis]|nr:hypothetical protein NC652_007527 [Populus alba x Populus x berolinensis]
MFRRAVKDFCTEAFNFLFRRSHASPQPNKFRKIMANRDQGVKSGKEVAKWVSVKSEKTREGWRKKLSGGAKAGH